MLIEELVPRVRTALGVSSSYDNIEIPTHIRAAIKRLLRDYNFPKSRARHSFVLSTLGESSFVLPADFKRAFGLMFFDPSDVSWSDPIQRAEGFQLPSQSGLTDRWWLEGQSLYINTPIQDDGLNKHLVLFYQSNGVEENASWLLNDFEDAVAYLAIVRGAADMRKAEVMQTYAPLWSDEQTSLAIYLNELEWDGVIVKMREERQRPVERYGR